MVYDRYGSLIQGCEHGAQKGCPYSSGGLQPREPCHEPAAGAGQEGPVPNTEYKVVGDPRIVMETGKDADELVLTPEANSYYEDLYRLRKGVAEEVQG